MWKSSIIRVFIHAFISFIHCDVHSIACHFIGSEHPNLPNYIERVTVDDVTVFYYDSSLTSVAPCPEWLKTPDGQQHWKESTLLMRRNQAQMAEALQTAKQQFNHTGKLSVINVYQGYSRCDLYPDGTKKSFLSHAFNGKDFLSLDIENKRFIASVPEANKYKNMRENHVLLIEKLVYFYQKSCFERLKMFLENAPGVHLKKVPEVRLFEKQRADSTLLTCHVTGFYPKLVQVKWIGADLQLVDDAMNDILPNGDGTYQTRRSVIRPKGNTGDQRYSCIVHHSSLEGKNYTVIWGKEEQHAKKLGVWITLGMFSLVVIGLFIKFFFTRMR